MEPLEPAENLLPAAPSGVPEGVVNVDAWQRMQELKAHPLYSGPERIVQTSIEGLQSDGQTSTGNRKRKLVALPREEHQQIRALPAAGSGLARTLPARGGVDRYREALGPTLRAKDAGLPVGPSDRIKLCK
ncbi:hypothetical protein GCM10011375_40780 [Hymenobacter qilianensis]|uniref:Uncharacterized protein n=2 Tax=Hymenobacter qilianensis TaxID=1385715 RepID=A0ACB5PXD8_9BACT|nr:hypothetical protein [Hymenobacter qilianensis]QNP54534.1 hypothetical protein H9L05_22755 [Hymenobacter qilianensis]GGF81646.1 hypothetical protein GCM10011375_40780 [Hymenobacter qilianensis]